MSSFSNSPIGIIDSGMGGISVWAEITRIMPHEDVIYWADTAHCPYGGRTRDEITALACVGVENLLERGAKIIVIGARRSLIFSFLFKGVKDSASPLLFDISIWAKLKADLPVPLSE